MLVSNNNLFVGSIRKVKEFIADHNIKVNKFYVDPLDGHLYQLGESKQGFHINENGHLNTSNK